METNQKLLVSRRESAEMLGLSLRGIDFLIHQGRLPSRKLGRRRLIPRAALESFARHDLARIVPAPEERDAR